MLWILIGLFLFFCIVGLFTDMEEVSVGAGIFFVIFLVIALFMLGAYNDTKTSADKKIAILEKRNEEVIKQIEPLVKQYLEYETSTYKELKPNADKLIALSQYPELKGNEFVQAQINLILENQKRITDLKIEKAGLNAYKLWLFMGE